MAFLKYVHYSFIYNFHQFVRQTITPYFSLFNLFINATQYSIVSIRFVLISASNLFLILFQFIFQPFFISTFLYVSLFIYLFLLPLLLLLISIETVEALQSTAVNRQRQ